MSYEFVEVAQDGHLLTVTLNRPQARNALNSAAHQELNRIFDAFEADPDQWVAIITGAGDKAFSAGQDLKEAQGGFDKLDIPATGFAGLTSRYGRKKPIIAAVNGFATGGGFELALACDLIIAADTARFGLTEPRVGMAALGGGIQRLTREVGSKRANAILLTGRIISAAEAMALGVVNEIVPQAELMAAARRWAEEIMLCSPTAIGATLAVANAFDGRSVQDSLETMMSLPETSALVASADAREGAMAFAERRPPRWSNA
jgi:enoyl-CoA hydratase/carnithine racemase